MSEEAAATAEPVAETSTEVSSAEATPQQGDTLLGNQPEPVASTDPSDPWVADGKFTPAFYDQLGSDGTKSIMEKYQGDPLKAIKALDESQRFIGKRLMVPNGETDPAVLSKFREVNGIPDTPDGYNVKAPDNLPDGVEFDEQNFVSHYAPLFHELNLTPAQAEAIVAKHIEVEGLRAAEMSAAIDSNSATYIAEQKNILQKEFGTNYDSKISDAQRFALTLGVDLNNAEIGNNAELIKAFAKGAGLISPDRMVPPAEVQTAQSYGALAKDIQTNPNNPDHALYTGTAGNRSEQEAVRSKVRQMIEKAQS